MSTTHAQHVARARRLRHTARSLARSAMVARAARRRGMPVVDLRLVDYDTDVPSVPAPLSEAGWQDTTQVAAHVEAWRVAVVADQSMTHPDALRQLAYGAGHLFM